jgi:diguanylate cyclase (GGDEF)-like protein
MTAVQMMGYIAAVPQVLVAAAWIVCGWLVAPSRRVAAHGVAAALAGAANAVLVAQRGQLDAWLTHALAGVSLLASMVLIRRAMQLLTRMAPTDVEHAVLLLLLLAMMLPLGDSVQEQPRRVMLLSAAQAWVMTRLMLEQRRAVPREFGRRTAVAMGVCGVAAVLLFAARLLVAALLPQAMLPQALGSAAVLLTPLSAAMALAILAVGLMQHGAVGYLVLRRLVADLAHLSRHDPLTGALNRRAMDDAVRTECERAFRGGEPFSLLLLDLDHFKQVNDRLGHAVGDDTLRRVADVLQHELRSTDALSRYGGEEFCVLLRLTGEAGAEVLARRLCDAVRAAGLPGGSADGSPSAMTVSVGVAHLTAHRPPPDATHPPQLLDAQALQAAMLLAADRAMYRAKAQGRDRIELVPVVVPM